MKNSEIYRISKEAVNELIDKSNSDRGLKNDEFFKDHIWDTYTFYFNGYKKVDENDEDVWWDKESNACQFYFNTILAIYSVIFLDIDNKRSITIHEIEKSYKIKKEIYL